MEQPTVEAKEGGIKGAESTDSIKQSGHIHTHAHTKTPVFYFEINKFIPFDAYQMPNKPKHGMKRDNGTER